MESIDLSKYFSSGDIRGLMGIPNNIIMSWDSKNRIEYYGFLKELAEQHKTKSGMSFVQSAFGFLGPVLRSFGYEVSGIENIPSTGALFAFNHSNTHDAITLMQVLKKYGIPISIMVTTEGVSDAIVSLYEKAGFVTMDRTNKDSCIDAMFELSSKMLQKNFSYGGIAPESTWNVDPILPSRNWKYGVAKIAAVTEKPTVPVIMEYVEVPYTVEKESQLYKKCVVRFGKPINIHYNDDLILRTNGIQEIATGMREEIWAQEGIDRSSLDKINPSVYCNHTGLKVGFGNKGPATFDYERERRQLLINPGEKSEWMYTMNDSGILVPGELTEEVFRRTLSR